MMARGRYWDNVGPRQADYDRLYKELVPGSGDAETVEGQLLRAASKLAWDFYNNGGGNNVSGALVYLKENFPGFKQSWWDALSPNVCGIVNDDVKDILPVCEEIVDKVTAYVVRRKGKYAENKHDMLALKMPDVETKYPDIATDLYEDEDEELSLAR
jgi:hypothetical protein